MIHAEGCDCCSCIVERGPDRVTRVFNVLDIPVGVIIFALTWGGLILHQWWWIYVACFLLPLKVITEAAHTRHRLIDLPWYIAIRQVIPGASWLYMRVHLWRYHRRMDRRS